MQPPAPHTEKPVKRFELWLRRAFVGGIGGSAPRRVDSPLMAFDVPENPKILLLRQDKIGDALVSIPVVRCLKQHLPHARLSMLLGARNHGISPALSGYVDSFPVYRKNPGSLAALLSRLRRERYDVLIDLMDNPSATSTLLVRAVKARYALGIDKENAAVYSHVVPLADRKRVHIVERLAQLLLPFGIDPAAVNLRLEYPLSEGDKQTALERLGSAPQAGRLGINISGNSRNRFWGRENFIRLANDIHREYPQLDMPVFAAPGFEEDQAAICAASAARPAPMVGSFHEFAAMLHTCNVLFTPDTSAVHLAAAWRIPCVALYIHVNPGLLPWTPYQSPHQALTTESNQLSSISHSRALEALREMLALQYNTPSKQSAD